MNSLQKVARSSFFVVRSRRSQARACNEQRTTNNQQRLSPSAFTLTEVLVVITILAILAALSTVGIMRALDTARQTAIKIEVDNLDAALKAYKDKYGSYPPSNLYMTATAMPGTPEYNAPLRQHLYKAFPRYDQSNLYDDLVTEVGIDMTGAFGERRDQALVLWLGGFSKDPTQPFLGLRSSSKAQRTTPFFDFEGTRLQPLPGSLAPSYHPPAVKNKAPYVYFHASEYVPITLPGSQPKLTFGLNQIPQDPGYAMPYVNDVDRDGKINLVSAGGQDDWVNPDTYQIIATGMDGKYGSNSTASENPRVTNTWRPYPTGTRFDPASTVTPRVGYDLKGADDDNVTNFCGSARLGDAKP